ncbi:Uncharacterized protein APZ42_006228, partial [Daphnia magna]
MAPHLGLARKPNMVSTYVRRGPYQKTAPFPGFSLAQWDGHVTIFSIHAV